MLEQQEKIKEKMVGNVLKTNLGVYDFFLKQTKKPQNKPVDFAGFWVGFLENNVNLVPYKTFC